MADSTVSTPEVDPGESAAEAQGTPDELKTRAARTAATTILMFALNRGVLFISTAVLAHLLRPADFGVVALTSTVIFALSILRDVGLGDTVISRQDLPAAAQGTILTLMLAAAAAVALLAVAAAPGLAAFFHKPRMITVLMSLAPVICIGGLFGFYDSVLQREFEYKKRFLVSLVQAVVYTGVSIALAFAGFGIWSLIVGQLASNGVCVVVLLIVTRKYRVWPSFDRSIARQVMQSGRPFLVLGLIDFFQQNTDYLSVGRFVSAAQVSFYYMSYRIPELFSSTIAASASRVSFASFARLRAQGKDIGPSFISLLRLLALLACPVGVIVSATASPLVRTLYGNRWVPMISVLSIMGIWGAIRPLEITIGWLLNSVGKAHIGMRAGLVAYAVLLPSVMAAAALGGIHAVAWVMLSYNLAITVVMSALVSRHAGIQVRRQWRAFRSVVLASPVAWLAAHTVASVVPGPVPALAAGVLTGVASYTAILMLFDSTLIPWALHQLLRIVRDPASESPRLVERPIV